MDINTAEEKQQKNKQTLTANANFMQSDEIQWRLVNAVRMRLS